MGELKIILKKYLCENCGIKEDWLCPNCAIVEDEIEEIKKVVISKEEILEKLWSKANHITDAATKEDWWMIKKKDWNKIAKAISEEINKKLFGDK